MTESRHCLQHAGDILFVPRLWGHAVLNSATCIGCAQGALRVLCSLAEIVFVPRPFTKKLAYQITSHATRPSEFDMRNIDVKS